MTAAVKLTIESLEKEIANQCAEILYLKEQNAWLLRQIFGKKSERIVDVNQEQLHLDGFEAAGQEKTETQTIPTHERKKRTSTGEDAIKLPDDLPVETTVIDIPEEEKICKETGIPLQKIGEEVSHKLAHRPGSYFLKRIVRPKYAHPKQEEKGIIIDESPVDIFDSPKVQQGYMWVLVGGVGADPPYRYYEFYEDRKHSHAGEILGSYAGIIHSDKYGAYETYIRKNGNIWCPCFAHIRRKFFEAEMGDPSLRTWVLEQIQQLFCLEEIAWTLAPLERVQLRQTQAVPIIDALIDRVKKRLTVGIILPKSKFKEALGYFCSLIPYLKNYTQHASARLDNNPAERAIRPLAIGRKNWLFFGSVESGEAAATLLSLTQTCRALNINPRTYLEDVCRRIMGHSAHKLYELLPGEWIKAQAASRETSPS